MKIEHVTATQLRLPQVANVFDGTQDVLVVQVMTDSGETGLGEVVSSSYVAKGIIEAPRSGGGRHGLREAVLGMDATDIDAVWKHMYDATAWYGRRGVAIHAMSGIEMALWDLKGKAEGTPVYRLLGGTEVPPPQPRIRAYASVLWGDTLDATLANAQRLLEQGFSALKFGFGPFGLGDISEDVQNPEGGEAVSRRLTGVDGRRRPQVERRTRGRGVRRTRRRRPGMDRRAAASRRPDRLPRAMRHLPSPYRGCGNRKRRPHSSRTTSTRASPSSSPIWGAAAYGPACD